MRTNDFNQNTLISVDQMMQEMMESVMPGDLMVLADPAANMMLDQTRQMMGNLVGYKELMIVYFKEYAELKDGRFLAFFDKNQVVQTENVPEWVEKSECRLLLTKNCRNTYEIALTAYNVIDVELNQKIQMMNGEKTSLAFVKGDPMGKLVKLLRMLTGDKYGYDYSDIVILTLKTESESIMNNISKISGIPITREKSNSSILFTTAKKFKGLESRVIIIVDIDESSFNDEKEKRNFYVACSRATQYLSLIVEGDDQKIKSIADVIAGPNFAPKGKIAMKTQATPLRLD